MPSSQIEELIQSLKQEIDELAQQQSRAAQLAIYVRMSRNEGVEYDERQKRITELMRKLNALKES